MSAELHHNMSQEELLFSILSVLAIRAGGEIALENLSELSGKTFATHIHIDRANDRIVVSSATETKSMNFPPNVEDGEPVDPFATDADNEGLPMDEDLRAPLRSEPELPASPQIFTYRWN